MVLQDTHLFTGTVRDNIAYGKLDATDGMAVALCHWFTTSNLLTHLTAGDKRKGLGGDSKARKGSSSWKAFVESNPDRVKK